MDIAVEQSAKNAAEIAKISKKKDPIAEVQDVRTKAGSITDRVLNVKAPVDQIFTLKQTGSKNYVLAEKPKKSGKPKAGLKKPSKTK